jgi:CRP-like cAMP-binding protein
MSLVEIEQNNFIFKQGTIGNYFYILKSGSAELLVNHQLIKILKKGESFGELALLHDAPRSGSIKAITDCLLWTLERKNFRKIVEHITKINYEENLKFIESVSILSHMEQYQKTILSTNIVKEEFPKGRIIVKKGEISSCLYIIKNGCVDCIDENGIVIRTLKEGDNFGERSILVDTKRTLDVVAKTNCICYSISISTLKSMLGEKYRSFLYLNFMKTAFQNSKLLNNLNTYFIEDVFKFFEAVNLGSDNVAFPIKHNKSSNIVIVIDGNLINVRIYLNYFII